MHIKIKTPSRLHLGILDLNGNLGRLYGSIGVAIEKPNLILEMRSAERLEVCGDGRDVVINLIKKFSRFYRIKPKVMVELRKWIPEHVGLGSGTQLALAVATSLSGIYKLDATTRELAMAMERGILSGIGIAAFEVGGFVIDSGINVLDPMPPQVVFHHLFPENWSFVVAIPRVKRGFSGIKEREAFKRIIPAPEKIPAQICRIVQMKMLPSLIEEDIETFGRSLSEIDKKTGLYFKDVQSGIYREKISQRLIEFMLDFGSYGVGQSSWGPTVYGLTKKKESEDLENEVREFLDENKIRGDVFSANANNRGALVEVKS